MPDRACRLASLMRYSRAKYPWMNSVGTVGTIGTVEAAESSETAAAVVGATPEYSMRGYYTKQESARSTPRGHRDRHDASSGPVSTVSVSTGQQMALARELRSIPSAIVATAAMRL
jgi:hypothetical protein